MVVQLVQHGALDLSSPTNAGSDSKRKQITFPDTVVALRAFKLLLNETGSAAKVRLPRRIGALRRPLLLAIIAWSERGRARMMSDQAAWPPPAAIRRSPFARPGIRLDGHAVAEVQAEHQAVARKPYPLARVAPGDVGLS